MPLQTARRLMVPLGLMALGAVASLWFVYQPRSAAEWLTRAGAMLALAAMLLHVLIGWVRGRFRRTGTSFGSHDTTPDAVDDLEVAPGGLSVLLRVIALTAGAAAGVLLVVVLGVRATYAAIEMASIIPAIDTRPYGFGPSGLVSLGLLYLACVAAGATTADYRLAACRLVLAVLAGAWACLLPPVYEATARGGLQRTWGITGLLLWIAVVTAGSVCWRYLHERRARRQLASAQADDLLDTPTQSPMTHRISALLLLLVLLLTAYHLAVPIVPERLGVRGAALVASVAALIGAAAGFLLTAQRWSVPVADLSLGLLSLAQCAVAVAVLPGSGVSLTEQYPILLNAMVVGLAMAVALATWLALFWEQQLDGGAATTAGRMIPHAKRSAFLSAVLALTLGGIMTIWPRLRAVGVENLDASPTRLTAGLGGMLFLLLVLLWSARKLRRTTLHMLSVLVLFCAAAFMVVRMLPYSPLYG